LVSFFPSYTENSRYLPVVNHAAFFQHTDGKILLSVRIS